MPVIRARNPDSRPKAAVGGRCLGALNGPARSVPAVARNRAEHGVAAVHRQSHQRIPAPRLIAVIARSAIAVVKRVNFAFT
jgi:hypothetical protein